MRALGEAAAEPLIVRRAHPAALAVRLWRGAVPILARPDAIFWPGAPEDLSAAGDRAMAILQHELQHVLDYAAGELTAAGYLLNPRNWRYRYQPSASATWRQFGAEQRAQIVEDLWLVERGLIVGQAPLEWYRRIVPWA